MMCTSRPGTYHLFSLVIFMGNPSLRLSEVLVEVEHNDDVYI